MRPKNLTARLSWQFVIYSVVCFALGAAITEPPLDIAPVIGGLGFLVAGLTCAAVGRQKEYRRTEATVGLVLALTLAALLVISVLFVTIIFATTGEPAWTPLPGLEESL